MRTIALISIFLLGTAFSFGLTGGWTRDSFAKNSLYIDRSRSKGEEAIKANFGVNDEKTIVYPLEIYKQLVNGFNYKTVYAFYDTEKDVIDGFSAIVYTGPFSKKTPSFEVINVEKLESSETVVNDAKLIKKIDDVLNKYLNRNDIHNSQIVKTFKKPITMNTSVYVVKTEENKGKYLIFQDENGELKVDAHVILYNN